MCRLAARGPRRSAAAQNFSQTYAVIGWQVQNLTEFGLALLGAVAQNASTRPWQCKLGGGDGADPSHLSFVAGQGRGPERRNRLRPALHRRGRQPAGGGSQ